MHVGWGRLTIQLHHERRLGPLNYPTTACT